LPATAVRLPGSPTPEPSPSPASRSTRARQRRPARCGHPATSPLSKTRAPVHHRSRLRSPGPPAGGTSPLRPDLQTRRTRGSAHLPRAPFTGRTKITKTKPSPHLSADAAWPACTGHVAAGAQSDLIWVHRLVTAEVPPTVQNGGSMRFAWIQGRLLSVIPGSCCRSPCRVCIAASRLVGGALRAHNGCFCALRLRVSRRAHAGEHALARPARFHHRRHRAPHRPAGVRLGGPLPETFGHAARFQLGLRLIPAIRRLLVRVEGCGVRSCRLRSGRRRR
jgi:hypothetical protein